MSELQFLLLTLVYVDKNFTFPVNEVPERTHICLIGQYDGEPLAWVITNLEKAVTETKKYKYASE
jgi:hypothetical protein